MLWSSFRQGNQRPKATLQEKSRKAKLQGIVLLTWKKHTDTGKQSSGYQRDTGGRAEEWVKGSLHGDRWKLNSWRSAGCSVNRSRNIICTHEAYIML